MSVTVQSGHNSLVSLGVGVSEIATLYSLGKRLGNWMTAQSGDADLLALIDQDEMEILRRRGLIDIQRWNKQWSKSLELIVNSRPQKLEGPAAEKALGSLSRFTAAMVTVVAALDPFVDTITFMKAIVKRLLKKLLGPAEYGDEVLTSQLNSRVNAWRSSALVRGLIEDARGIYVNLLERGDIEAGLMPHREMEDVSEFLFWLLAENTEEFSTTSSDIKGIAICLSHLGMDQLGVTWDKSLSTDRPYRLVYTQCTILNRGSKNYRTSQRLPSTTVSLTQPEESLTKFPVDYLTSSRCRFAWKYGAEASKAIIIGVGAEPVDSVAPNGAETFAELQYQVCKIGTPVSREDTAHFPLASAFGFVTNRELLDGIKAALDKESDEMLTWILAQTREVDQEDIDSEHISSVEMTDQDRVNSYTVFQAFIMGYYYTLFLGDLVDTSKLAIKSVDGAWGFRDTSFLSSMRRGQTVLKKTGLRLQRSNILRTLSTLFMSHNGLSIKQDRHGYGPILGVIGKRSILANSLIGPCDTPLNIGGFTILDCDTSGIPTDTGGLVRSGIPGRYMEGRVMNSPEALNKKFVRHLLQSGPREDFTRHIEADWDGNPDNMLLVFRYRGRRLGSVDPSEADALFCHVYIDPVTRPIQSGGDIVEAAFECTINDVLSGNLMVSGRGFFPVVVQSYNCPCMRYALVAFYDSKDVVVSSNCIQTALNISRERGSNVVIAGTARQDIRVNHYQTKEDEKLSRVYKPDGGDQRVLIWNERLGRFAKSDGNGLDVLG